MRLSTSTAILHHHFDYALTLTDIPAVIRTAGFDALDWSTWQFCLQGGKVFAGLLNDDAWEAQINALREADERAGIVCRQTHCVSTNYARYQTLDAEHLRLLEQRCIRTFKNGFEKRGGFLVEQIHHPLNMLALAIDILADRTNALLVERVALLFGNMGKQPCIKRIRHRRNRLFFIDRQRYFMLNNHCAVLFQIILK